MPELHLGAVAGTMSGVPDGLATAARRVPMDDVSLLAVMLRGRPVTSEAAAALAHLDLDEARAGIERLRHRGIVGGEGDAVAYMHPATWAAQAVSARADALRALTAVAMGDIDDAVARLPGMLKDWAVGEVSDDLVPVLTRHGLHASEDLWYDAAAHDSGTLSAVLPEVDRFLVPDPQRAERFGRALAGKERVRVIMPTWAADDPVAKQRMLHYRAAGVEYRLLDRPASWFWVDGDLIAVPFEWGEGRPTSVLAVRNAALAGMARDYFDQLWRRAAPAVPVEHAWAPLLILMRQGTTLDTASRTLGINPRTGRRRVAAAMEHYGVSTLFALGVAFGADTTSSGSRRAAGS